MQKGSPREAGQAQVLILAGAVLLIAVAGGIFFLGRVTVPKPQPQDVATSSPQPSPTPDETVYTESDRSANWKTFKDAKNNYSFRYPNDYIIETTPAENLSWQVIAIHSPDSKTDPNLGGFATGIQLTVNIHDDPEGSNFQKLPLASLPDSSFIPKSLSRITAGGRRPNYYQVITQIGIGQKMLTFNCFTHPDIDPNNTGTPCAKLLNQILSTFKFLD